MLLRSPGTCLYGIKSLSLVFEVAEKVKKEHPVAMDTGQNSSMIVLNSTSEFCRSLGDIPTYGLSGNRDEERDELLVRPTKSSSPSVVDLCYIGWKKWKFFLTVSAL